MTATRCRPQSRNRLLTAGLYRESVIPGRLLLLSVLAVVSLVGCAAAKPSVSPAVAGTSSASSGSDTPRPSAGPLVARATRNGVAVTKVLVFVEENHSLAQMRSDMPYAAGLAQRFGYATDYTAIRHPSEPNYIAIAGGQTYGITNDDSPSDNPVSGTSVFGQALAAGKTAALYADGMPANCSVSDGGDHYAVKHNPWAYFTAERAACQQFDVPTDHLEKAVTDGTLPNVGMVVPNLDHDAHDGSLAAADAWFKDWMTKIFDGPDWMSGHLAVVLTADEDNRYAGNKVLTVVIHPSQHGTVVSTPLTHYSLTRLYEDVAGVPPMFEAASAPSLLKAFGLPLT